MRRVVRPRRVRVYQRWPEKLFAAAAAEAARRGMTLTALTEEAVRRELEERMRPMMVRFCGWAAIEAAEALSVSLCHYNTPMLAAAQDVDIEEAREIARDDPGLVYADVPAAILVREFARVFGRPAEIVEAYDDGAEVAIVVEGWPEPVRYDPGQAWRTLRQWAAGEGAGEGEVEVCRALEEEGAVRGIGYRRDGDR